MRIAIIGTSGSGKTTLATAIAAATGMPRIELDAINWQPGWRGLSQDEPATFAARVAEAAAAACWVGDGNYGASRPVLFDRATDIVWLDYPRSLVMRRVVRRSFARAWSGAELWPGTGNRERFADWRDPEHPIRWAWSTHARRADAFATLIADAAAAGKRVHRIRNPGEARALLRGMLGLRE